MTPLSDRMRYHAEHYGNLVTRAELLRWASILDALHAPLVQVMYNARPSELQRSQLMTAYGFITNYTVNPLDEEVDNG